MRWDRLFDDLEAELEAVEAAEIESEVAERTRFERSRLRLVDRLRGSMGRHVGMRVGGAGLLTGEIRAVGVDWLLIRPPGSADRLVRTAALLEVTGLAASSAVEGSEGVVAARFALTAVLRGLARDRTVVTITLVDGSALTGTIELAGADLLELSDRRHDEPDLAGPPSTTGRRTIPLSALAVVCEH